MLFFSLIFPLTNTFPMSAVRPFCHIRQLRQIPPSLDLISSIQLANAIVSSKLDYCNSLFYGLADTSIQRLQRVKNSLARVIFPSLKRSDHITPSLVKRHWLSIH